MNERRAGQADTYFEKKKLRAGLAALGRSLGASYIARSDEGIFRMIASFGPFLEADSIFCYLSRGTEPDTRKLIRLALSLGKKVYCPAIPEKGRMTAVRLTAPDRLKTGMFGIDEPEGCETAGPDEFGFSVVPCLSAAPDGTRLGYGGGYYDRFFAGTGPVLNAAVLCRERLLSAELPTGEYDVVFGNVITEERIISAADSPERRPRAGTHNGEEKGSRDCTENAP